MKLWRGLAHLCWVSCGVFAGCSIASWFPMPTYLPAYGVPPPPHDSTVTLTDFSYTPAQVSAGGVLTISARLNKPTQAADLLARFSNLGIERYADLNDRGYAPDDVANDGVWHGELTWDIAAGPPGKYAALLLLSWDDGAEGQSRLGQPLTVLPEEGDQ